MARESYSAKISIDTMTEVLTFTGKAIGVMVLILLCFVVRQHHR